MTPSIPPLIALFALFLSIIAPAVSLTPDSATTSYFDRPGGPQLLAKAVDLQKAIETAGGCPLDVCFALDGSASLSPQDYEYQKEFSQLVALVLSADSRSRYTAVQYGLPAIAISNFTSSAAEFVRRVSASKFASARRTFISSGLLFCTVTLGKQHENIDAIVLLGDGMVNIGADPFKLSRKFLPPEGNGSILAVGVGEVNPTSLERITGRQDAVVSINNQRNLPNVLEKTILFLCRI